MKFRQDLTKERLREKLNYDPETGIFTWAVDHRNAKIGSPAGWLDGCGYVQIMVDGVGYLAHRLAWLYHYGEWPYNQLDHDNRDRADNRISNLNASSKIHNAKNSGLRSDNTSGIPGINWNKREGKWIVRIQSSGIRIHGGYFTRIKDAIKKRNELKKMYNFR